MGWTDLFKSKASKLKADDRLRWFGKLSTYADYYSSKADEEWAVEFNDWVLKGYELYVSRQKAAGLHVEQLPMSRMALRLPKSGMTVLASVQDYGGDMRGRPFPLCFYVGIPTANWPGPAHDRLLPALTALRDLEDLQRDVTRFFKAPGRFESVFADRRVQLDGIESTESDAAWTQRAKEISLTDWFNGASTGLGTVSATTWFRLARNWGEAVAGLCRESSDAEATLRFPIAAGVDIDAQTAGWMRWLENKLDLSKRYVSLLLSEPEAGRPGRLTVVAREPLADDFLLLTPQAESLNYVDDMSKVGAKAGNGETSEIDTTAPAGSWLDFVEGR